MKRVLLVAAIAACGERRPAPSAPLVDARSPVVDARSPVSRSTVRVTEHVDGQLGHRTLFSITLEVGDRVGRVVNMEAATGTWRGWRTLPVDSSLYEPWPVDDLLAFCHYRNGGLLKDLALGRSSDDIVLWQRNDVDAAWFEVTRLPFDVDAELELELPWGPIGTSPYEPLYK